MKTEPTDAEINEGIAKWIDTQRPPAAHHWMRDHYLGDDRCAFCGMEKGTGDVCVYDHQHPSYTTSFDALREAIWKMDINQEIQLIGRLSVIHHDQREDGEQSFDFWLLFHCPARTLAEAVYQVVKGENK